MVLSTIANDWIANDWIAKQDQPFSILAKALKNRFCLRFSHVYPSNCNETIRILVIGLLNSQGRTDTVQCICVLWNWINLVRKLPGHCATIVSGKHQRMTKGTNNWLKQLAEAIRQKQLAETIAQGNWMKKLAKATGQRKSHQ